MPELEVRKSQIKIERICFLDGVVTALCQDDGFACLAQRFNIHDEFIAWNPLILIIAGYTPGRCHEILQQSADSAVSEPLIREFMSSVWSEEMENRPGLVHMGCRFLVKAVTVVMHPELIHNLAYLHVGNRISTYTEN